MEISEERLSVAIHTPRMRGIGQIPSEPITEGEVSEMARELRARRNADRKQVFTPEQVHNLNRYQSEGRFHPFTCGSRNRTEHPDKEGILVATIYGWVCPYCEYTQDWAHDFMKRPLPAPSEVSNEGQCD